MPLKKRLDVLLVERGLAETREKAQALIMAGLVLVDGHKATKAGAAVPEGLPILLKEGASPYVGRGGLKLEGDYCSREEWKEYLLDKAKTALSERRYEEYKARVSVSS